MKHIKRKITLSVLGTMLFVFAALLATVNIFIPEYLTSEAQKAIIWEDERKDPVPLTEATDFEEEHFLTSDVRYLEVEEGLAESEHLSKAEYQLREYCRKEKPTADEFHTLKTGGNRFVFRITHVEADEYEDAYSYILYVDVGAVMQYSAYLNAVFFAVLAVLSVLVCLFGRKLGGYVERAHESQKWFFQNVSHELKTPLAVIRADAEVIELTGGENEWTKSILNQTDRLSELLSQLLTLTKSQENLQSSFAEFSLSEVVEQAAQGFKPLFDSKSLPFEINVAEGLALFGSETLVRELVSILLENASKYSSAGGSVSLTLVQTGGKAELKAVNFCDDPPQGDTRLLFERFYRADSSRTRETGGSGIGLSIARSIADAHKAKISCKVEGKRVGFCVRFPKVYKKAD